MPTLELDLTASVSANRKLAEDITLSGGSVRYVVLEEGFFYDKDLVIKDAITGQTLERFADYVLQAPMNITHSLPFPAYLIIVIKKPTVSRILVDSRAVGGWYSLTTQSISDILGLVVSGGSVDWGDILNIPASYYPAPHMHHARDIDWGSAILVLNDIRNGLENGQGLGSIFEYINQRCNNFELITDITNPVWGVMREKLTGFTINWGRLPTDTSINAQDPNGVEWTNVFKKSFSNQTPLVLTGGSFGNYKGYEQTSVDSDGFSHIVKYDTSIGSSAQETRWYIAIGMSSELTPVNNLEFFN